VGKIGFKVGMKERNYIHDERRDATDEVEVRDAESGSAVAEGPRDALVSRNFATYKTYHLKTIVWHYLQTDGQTDGQTHDDGIYRA